MKFTLKNNNLHHIKGIPNKNQNKDLTRCNGIDTEGKKLILTKKGVNKNMKSKNTSNLLAILLSTTFLTSIAHALKTPTVLPKGISRFRMVGVSLNSIDQKFNSNGNKSKLSPLNFSLNAKQLFHNNPAASGLVKGLNATSPGMGSQLLNLNYTHDIKMNQNAVVLAYEYGLMKNFNVGVRVPVVTRTYNSNLNGTLTNNANRVRAGLGENPNPELAGALDQIGKLDINNGFSLENLGYSIPSSFAKTEFGDLELGGKYAFVNTGSVTSSAQLGMRAPTGSTGSLENPFDSGSGNGVWSVGLSLYQDVTMWNGILTLSAYANGEYNFSDTKNRAVPKSSADILPSLVPAANQVQSVKRQQGALLETEVAATAFIPGNMFKVWGAYQYKEKGEDSFTGPSGFFYEALAKNTDHTATSAEVGLGFSTFSMFRKKDFPVPMEVEALYNSTLNGVNVPDVSYARVDLKLYF